MAPGRGRSSPRKRAATAAFPLTRPTSRGWGHLRKQRRSLATLRRRSRPGWLHSVASWTKRWYARSPVWRPPTPIWRCWKRLRRSRSAMGSRRFLSRLCCRQTHLLAQVGELIDKLGSHLRFLLIGEKRGVDGVERDALYAVSVIPPMPGQHQELVCQRCTEEGWIVGVDGHQYSGIVERPERVVGEAGHNAGAKVAGWAEFERNAVPGEAVDKPRIFYSAHAMPDSLHTEKIQGVANGGVTGGLASVRDGVESRRPGARKIGDERSGRIADLVPTQSQSYDAIIG